MKKISILFFLTFLSCLLFAAAPTVSPSNLAFNSLDGGQFSGSFTNGNGSFRVVVVKKGSPVTGVPVNGMDYTANERFGTAGSQFTEDGEYVVAKTGWSSFTVSNLQPGTTYYLAVFEGNGSGSSTQYLNLPLTGSQATVTAPTVQASAVTSPSSTGNTLTLNWTKGNGTGRLLIAHKGAAVDVTPADLTNYFSDAAFGSGTRIGTDQFVVYKGTGTGVTVKNLEPNTVYHFALFEYNGSVSPVHSLPGATFAATTHAGPTVASSSPGFSYVEGNSLTISVTYGNGTHRLFVASKKAPVTAMPANGATYTANGAFGTPGTEIAPDEFVVGATTGNGVKLTNLEPNTLYYFRVYEYDVDKADVTYYLTSSYAEKSGSTSITPSTVSSNFKLVGLTGSSAVISFTPGNGSYRTVLMKAGSAVDAQPTDLSTYSSNSNFGSGAQIGTGNYVVQWGMNGAQFTVNNLQPGITYHASIFEFNGSNAPVYSATGGTFSFTVPTEPTAAATSPWSTFTEGNAFRFIWTNGNGGKRIVIARKGSAVTAKPADLVSYTANAAFGSGDVLAEGEYVVYNGTGHEVDLTNLEVGTTYHFAVYEYNVGGNGQPDYLTTSWLAASAASAAKPTTQAVITSISNLQATQATINFTAGNGANRLFLMKQGSAVNATPQDLVRYTYQTAFGNASSLLSDGNYAVAIVSGGWPFTVTNLQPNTTYYMSAFDYNGSAAPAYLTTTPGTISFTTPDVPGATTPTTEATDAKASGVEGNKFTFKWTNGNGEKRIVVMRQGSAVDFVPASATSYPANAAFGNGTDLGGDQFIVYNGAGSSVDLTNLSPSTTYSFAVYEYNGTGTMIRYLTAARLTASAVTATAPSAPVSLLNAAAANGQITLNWMNGNGSGRLVVMKEGSSIAAAPVDLSVYPASASFKSGSQIAAGEYVVYAGNGSSVTVTGLEDKTYYFSVFEYNGSTAPVYNTTAATGSAVVSSTLPVKLLSFTAKASAERVVLNWATAQEINSALFAVERSADGAVYNTIATLAAAGNSNNEVRYSYTDRLPFTGKIYYRLKQVDADGKTTYSSVATVNATGQTTGLRVYPNPVNDQFRMTLPAAGEGLLSVSDSKGVQLIQQKITDGQAVNSSRLSRGVYFLRVEVKGRIYQTTFLKQ